MSYFIQKNPEGSVTTPKGYRASGVAAGIKKSVKLDLGVLVSDVPFQVAGVFTKNQLKGHSLLVAQKHLEEGVGQAVWVNSGNANACTGKRGWDDAMAICKHTALALQIPRHHVIPSSTGVIGEFMPVAKIKDGIDKACQALSVEGGAIMAEAIMTTDTQPKYTARTINIDGHVIAIGGIAKGSGMIHPNMATMLAYIATDARIQSAHLKKFLTIAVEKSFNRLSIDGDTSCDDTVLLLANGLSEAADIEFDQDESSVAFQEALNELCLELTMKMAEDGEGVNHVVTIHVEGATRREHARLIACSIAKSPLVKTALYGLDPNWGRFINAAGYSGINFDPNTVDFWIENIQVMKNGMRAEYNEDDAHRKMEEKQYSVYLNLNQGTEKDFYITTDFSNEYININADYRNRT